MKSEKINLSIYHFITFDYLKLRMKEVTIIFLFNLLFLFLHIVLYYEHIMLERFQKEKLISSTFPVVLSIDLCFFF